MECELRDSNVKHLETIHHLENDLGKSQQEKVQLEESHKMEMEKERYLCMYILYTENQVQNHYLRFNQSIES